jgi:hypothetical protein
VGSSYFQRLRVTEKCPVCCSERELVMSHTHCSYWSTAAIVLNLFARSATIETRLGAVESMEEPSSQWLTQNKVLRPLPTWMVTEACWNMAWAIFSSLLGSDTYSRSGPVCASHSQHSLRAYPMVAKSKTPRPPSSMGRATFVQATKHLPS